MNKGHLGAQRHCGHIRNRQSRYLIGGTWRLSSLKFISVVQTEFLVPILTTEIEKKLFEKMTVRTLTVGKNFFLDFFGRPWYKTDGFKKTQKKIFFEPKGHFRSFFRKNFQSTITSGRFQVDPENSSPQVERCQKVISSENNSNHDVHQIYHFLSNHHRDSDDP